MELPASFIPKKTIEENPLRRSNPTDFFSLIATIVFLISLLALLGVFIAETLYKKNKVELDSRIEREKTAFDTRAILDLERISKRLSIANELLTESSHLFPSRIFTLLENATLRTVRYSGFEYRIERGAGSQKILVNLEGEARDYAAIALQSDIFSDNQYVLDHVFSSLNTDRTGNISFDLSILVDPKIFVYEEVNESTLSLAKDKQ